MNIDEKWMQIAINEAKLAILKDEVPVGCVIVKNEKIIAKGHNQPINNNDPTAHAEIQAIRKAGKKQKNYRLTESTLYVTLEPCAMCFGAMTHARIKRVVFGAFDSKTGVCGSSGDLTNAAYLCHTIEISGGILEKECSEFLKKFFKSRR